MSNLTYEFFSGIEANILEAYKLDESIRFPWPPISHILYAIDEDKNIVGRIGILQLPHIEGTWVREDYRKGFVAVRMLSKIEEFIADNDRKAAFAFVKSDDIDIQNYMQRFGYVELPLKVYIKSLVEEEKVA